jgi:hypothetical protein
MGPSAPQGACQINIKTERKRYLSHPMIQAILKILFKNKGKKGLKVG